MCGVILCEMDRDVRVLIGMHLSKRASSRPKQENNEEEDLGGEQHMTENSTLSNIKPLQYGTVFRLLILNTMSQSSFASGYMTSKTVVVIFIPFFRLLLCLPKVRMILKKAA